jgi:hypothetical protein
MTKEMSLEEKHERKWRRRQILALRWLKDRANSRGYRRRAKVQPPEPLDITPEQVLATAEIDWLAVMKRDGSSHR